MLLSVANQCVTGMNCSEIDFSMDFMYKFIDAI